jgi:hypothetical protein
MALETASDPEDVEQLRRRFVEFRQAHAVRSRLPQELWAAAAKVARRDGITATARALGVDRPSLQRWTDRLEPRASTRTSKSVQRLPQGGGAPAFVELLADSLGTGTRCRMEVESRQGGKLRLELKGVAISQLAELIRAFAAC